MDWAVQNTPRTHLLRIVLRIKFFKINFFPKIPKFGFINFKIVFLKMQFFYSQFQNTLTQPFLHFLVYFFFFLNVRQIIIYNILHYLKIHICRIMAPFHGAHHICLLFSNIIIIIIIIIIVRQASVI